MLITIVSATPFEIQPTIDYLTEKGKVESPNLYVLEECKIRILITGVGMTLTALQLGLYLAKEQPNLLINAGVAGAFSKEVSLGDVVHVVSERFGDLGAEDKDGSFIDIHEMGLIKSNDAPFEEGVLLNKQADKFDFLPKVRGITINTVHGQSDSITAFKAKYTVDVETMEGVAFFLAALQTNTPFLAIRSISNYVEARNRDAWELGLAITKLNETLIGFINNFIDKN